MRQNIDCASEKKHAKIIAEQKKKRKGSQDSVKCSPIMCTQKIILEK